MRKNDYSIGNVRIDKFRTNLIVEKPLVSYSGERYGFNISLITSDLLTQDFKCGNKVKLNIQKMLIKKDAKSRLFLVLTIKHCGRIFLNYPFAKLYYLIKHKLLLRP